MTVAQCGRIALPIADCYCVKEKRQVSAPAGYGRDCGVVVVEGVALGLRVSEWYEVPPTTQVQVRCAGLERRRGALMLGPDCARPLSFVSVLRSSAPLHASGI